MGSIIEKLTHMTQIEYLFFTLCIVIVLFLVYIYFLTKEKKKLRETIDNNVKAFQKTCDISEDAIMILSAKNEVLYANSSMVRLLQFNNHFLSQKFRYA